MTDQIKRGIFALLLAKRLVTGADIEALDQVLDECDSGMGLAGAFDVDPGIPTGEVVIRLEAKGVKPGHAAPLTVGYACEHCNTLVDGRIAKCPNCGSTFKPE